MVKVTKTVRLPKGNDMSVLKGSVNASQLVAVTIYGELVSATYIHMMPHLQLSIVALVTSLAREIISNTYHTYIHIDTWYIHI